MQDLHENHVLVIVASCKNITIIIIIIIKKNNIVFSLEKCRAKLQTLCVNLQIPICRMLVELWEIYHG